MHISRPNLLEKYLVFVLVLAMAVGASLRQIQPARAAATLTAMPITWNVISLDSNNVNVGPNNFPVGARVCNTSSTDTATNVGSTFVWDTTDTNINLRPGSYGTDGKPFPTIPTLAPQACVEIYYEAQITRDSNTYDHKARYHITATADGLGISSTPTPRELYVEHLISQSRNYTFDVKLNGSPILNGGSMNLFVGQTYTITLDAKTATNGYDQIESFINFPNKIFQIISVNSTYTAFSGRGVTPIDKLYNNACSWDSDTNSPNFRSCLGVGKAGGDVANVYKIKIIGGGSSQQTLSDLIYDFSGSSFHYNSDYAVSYRLANIIDPSLVSIAKNFSPNPTQAGGVSTLTVTLHNGNTGTLSGRNFTDNLPTTPGAMVVANPPSATTSGCGTPTFAPTAGAGSISFSNGTIAGGGTCTVRVDVTATASESYANTTGVVSATTAGPGNTASNSLWVQAVHPMVSILMQVSTSPSGPWTTFDAVTLPASIYYQFTVENSGDVAPTSVSVTDPTLVPASPNIVCTPGSLALYEVKTCTFGPVTAISGSHANTATARGTYNSSVYDSTPSTASYATAALTIAKSVTEAAFTGAGDVLHYSYLVTNSGYASLREPVSVTDTKIGVLSCPATETVGDNDAFLDASESITCTGSYVVQAADVTNGFVTNVASATANGVTSNSYQFCGHLFHRPLCNLERPGTQSPTLVLSRRIDHL